jgi:ribokinase
MPKLVNLGSLCIDNVYTVLAITKPGETVAALDYQRHPGGKGLNQSLAAARAGLDVAHVGCVGNDGRWLTEVLASAGVDVAGLRISETEPSGHAVIQVDASGQNAIVIVGGANRSLEQRDLEFALSALEADDWLLIQNEINDIDKILNVFSDLPSRIAFNVAPADPRVVDYPLDVVDLLIVNEIEAAAIADGAAPAEAVDLLCARYPTCHVVLTCGARGLRYGIGGDRLELPAFPVDAVDETAAGDAFIGFLMHGWLNGHGPAEALAWASAAGALAVTVAGAATSIPTAAEVAEFLQRVQD